MWKLQTNVPRWFLALIVVSLLPMLFWPVVILGMNMPEGDSNRWMLFAFPVYALFSGYFAYRSYEDRKELAWILLVMLWLTTAAMFLL